MSRRTARGNRYGLTFAGLVLLAGGGLALARGFGAFGARDNQRRLLSSTETHYAATHGWFWPVVAAVAGVVALACLRWLIAQTRSERLRGFQLEPDRSAGSTRMPAKALTDAVADEVADYQGVNRASARLTSDPSHPQLQLSVALAPRADPGQVRQRIEAEALAHARQAIDIEELPTLITLRLDAGSPQRRAS